jgi:hypothetical protein
MGLQRFEADAEYSPASDFNIALAHHAAAPPCIRQHCNRAVIFPSILQLAFG